MTWYFVICLCNFVSSDQERFQSSGVVVVVVVVVIVVIVVVVVVVVVDGGGGVLLLLLGNGWNRFTIVRKCGLMSFV